MKYSILVIITLIMHDSFGFTLNSSTNPNLLGWADPNIQLMVNTTNCPAGVDVPGIISDAVKVWNNISTSSVKVSYGGTTTSTTFSSPPTVYCETNFQVVVGADQNFVPGAAAASTAGGRIVSGLMYLNASVGNANIANYDQTKLKIILAHEIGHILGLGHSESTPALMYYNAGAKSNLNLAQDDIDGMSYLYPNNELSNGKFAGCGLIKAIPPPSYTDKNTVLLLLLLPLILLFGLRNRRRAH